MEFIPANEVVTSQQYWFRQRVALMELERDQRVAATVARRLLGEKRPTTL